MKLTEQLWRLKQKAFPLWREDGRYDAAELADWFYQEAQKTARAFDTRDGYPYFAQQLEKAGHFFDWPCEKENA